MLFFPIKSSDIDNSKQCRHPDEPRLEKTWLYGSRRWLEA